MQDSTSASASVSLSAHGDAVPAQAAAVSGRTAEQLGAARADTAAPIPYRSDANGMAASTSSALLVAVLLLAALALGLRYAKRRGLLDRWIVAAPGRVAGRPDMQIVRALRVSPKTTLYRIRDADRHYLLVESLAQTTLTPIPDEDLPPHNDDGHDDAR
jgi:hypothetical protein